MSDCRQASTDHQLLDGELFEILAVSSRAIGFSSGAPLLSAFPVAHCIRIATPWVDCNESFIGVLQYVDFQVNDSLISTSAYFFIIP